MEVYLIYLILLRPIIYLIENYFFSWDIASKFGAIYMILFITIYFIYCFKKLNKKEKIISCSILIFTFIIMLFTGYSLNIINNTLRFNVALIILYLFTKTEFIMEFKKVVDKYIYYIISYAFITILVILMTILTQNGLVKSWGGSNYLQGPFKSPHDLAYYLIIVYAITTYCKFKLDRLYLYILNIFPLLLSFATGARVPFVIILLLAVLNIIYDFKKKPKLLLIISLVVLAVIIILISTGLINNIPMINKFIIKIQKNDFSSGRDYLWKDNVEEFMRFSLVNKLFGKGINYSYSYNLSKFKTAIWSHNDFIHILLSYGFTGLFIYISVIFYFIKENKMFISAFIILFLAFFNGFFTYYNFVFALPYIFILRNDIKKIIKFV